MAHIRIWQVKDSVNAEKLWNILNENKGARNLDIISDDCIFKTIVVNDDSNNSPGSIDRVVTMWDVPQSEVSGS